MNRRHCVVTESCSDEIFITLCPAPINRLVIRHGWHLYKICMPDLIGYLEMQEIKKIEEKEKRKKEAGND